jgi:hypothetical protein
MNSDELVKEILNDELFVKRKAVHLIKDFRREAIKTRNKHLTKYYNYKSPKKNYWLIYIENNSGSPRIVAIVYYIDDKGINAVTSSSNKEMIIHYSSHFLARYNERFLKQGNVSKLDVLKLFIPKNHVSTHGFLQHLNTGQITIFTKFKDGIGLGVYEEINDKKFISLKTYISEDMIKDSQQTAYGSLNESFIKYWDNFFAGRD